MVVSIKKSARKEAFLAMAFAAGMLGSQLPAPAESKSESAETVIQQIGDNSLITTELRAFYLLQIACVFLGGQSPDMVKKQYAHLAISPESKWPSRDRDEFLGAWADNVASSKGSQNLKLADVAIKKAVTELRQTPESFAKLNMYFVASRLFRRVGDLSGGIECDAVLERAFQSCEKGSWKNEEQIKAASSVLNSMSNSMVRVRIPDLSPKDDPIRRPSPVKSFTEREFVESERLRLRALAMVDRLDSNSHLRRKGHRDLALWYMQLGKMQKADVEKRILYNLVGFEDDSVLYAQSKGCGQLVWWQRERITCIAACGLG